MPRAFLAWPGGKYLMQKRILPLIENTPHTTFVEAFGGAGHIIFEKKPSQVDVYNDIDGGLVNFFNQLRTNPEKLIDQLTLTPYSRLEFDACANWVLVEDPLERARQWYVRSQQSFNSMAENWAYSGNVSRRGMSKRVSAWLRQVDERLPNAVSRVRELQIENLDFEPLILKYDSSDTMFYLDPAYLPDTRVRKKTYEYETSYADQVRLVKLLNTIAGKYLLSGYDNDLYRTLKCDKISIGEYYRTMGYSTKGSKYSKKEEFLWVKQ